MGGSPSREPGICYCSDVKLALRRNCPSLLCRAVIKLPSQVPRSFSTSAALHATLAQQCARQVRDPIPEHELCSPRNRDPVIMLGGVEKRETQHTTVSHVHCASIAAIRHAQSPLPHLNNRTNSACQAGQTRDMYVCTVNLTGLQEIKVADVVRSILTIGVGSIQVQLQQTRRVKQYPFCEKPRPLQSAQQSCPSKAFPPHRVAR